MQDLHSHEIRRAADRDTDGGEADSVTLDYAGRFLRRKRLTSDGGIGFLVDLAETASIEPGDAFLLSDGRQIAVRAADETLIEVTGPDLPRLAWHIGNRHTPCQIAPDRLVIAQDPVLAGMLRGLGATLRDITGPFRPEGGAYGHGRTMGHDHGDHGHHHVHHHGSHGTGAEDPAADLPPDE
ncbi:urease accessory protein UreE [Frigidibacter oleivorans]|uniref:urease accessory protein UreE n=1 Tax=Frigidibacter oleivorans TaxID=2487129 RepID=UPI000F8E1A04|nr:urease accessory protein UreE [Frigidibacter oleivorans]